jgi:hypothetical protein
MLSIGRRAFATGSAPRGERVRTGETPMNIIVIILDVLSQLTSFAQIFSVFVEILRALGVSI